MKFLHYTAVLSPMENMHANNSYFVDLLERHFTTLSCGFFLWSRKRDSIRRQSCWDFMSFAVNCARKTSQLVNLFSCSVYPGSKNNLKYCSYAILKYKNVTKRALRWSGEIYYDTLNIHYSCCQRRSRQGHFLSTHPFPWSSYSCFDIHICWNEPWKKKK